MKEVIEKIYTRRSEDAVNSILEDYYQNGFSVVNFIYFANIVSQKLFSSASSKTEKEKEYKKILLRAPFLLPDGIALQLFYFCAKLFGNLSGEKPWWLHNLNGTDFVPYFLSEAKRQYGNQKFCLLLYGTKEEYVEQVKHKLQLQGFNVIYAQDGYSEFDWGNAENAMKEYQDTINILLVARSTPTIPLQELWTNRNYQKIIQHRLLVFNTGGLFDFIAGVQKRAPKIWRVMKLEWVYRLFSDPKRNFKKVRNSLLLFPYIIKYCIFKR